MQKNPITVAIVGAGLSGLVSARILQLNDVPVTVYEAEPSASSRQQGGSLDIHSDTGQVALKAAGLYDEFLRNCHSGGEATRVLDKNAHVYIDEHEPDGGNGRPEISRVTLRRLLIDSLTPGTIAWGKKVIAVRTAHSQHQLQFPDGGTARADLVVGADGAWSKVRSLLTTVKPEYSGVTVVEISLADAASRHPEALALVGQGSLFALGDNKYIGGHGGESIALGLGMRVSDDWITTSGIDWTDPGVTRAALLREFSDWDGSLTDLIRDCDDLIVPRPIYALPTGHRWQRRAGVTLIGDAAHLMSPFAGEGANLALIDGADLAKAILTEDSIETALTRYEKRMFRRGAKSAAQSETGLARMFDAQAPKRMVSFFRRMQILTRLLKPLQRSFARGEAAA